MRILFIHEWIYMRMLIHEWIYMCIFIHEWIYMRIIIYIYMNGLTCFKTLNSTPLYKYQGVLGV